ncbi:MAG: glycerol kinase GlpK [Ktedonobacterales bacterium]|nr:glycerol kinase GlpK [Ktedonobacterales bacterium]
MTQYILALDQGTTSSRAMLFNAQGQSVATAQQEFPQIFPAPGLVEHDPEAIWQSQLATARALMAQAGATARDIAGIGLTNQRETTVLWDRATGQPVHNAIVWQSRLTEPLCAELRARGLEAPIRAKTGLVIDAYFSGTKIAWLLDNVPGLRARAEAGEIAFGTVDTFLLWRLSGGRIHATDHSNASRTLIYNIHTLDWDADLLRELNIPRALLPRVLPSSHIYGMTDPALFGGEIPLAGVAGDQQAATFGQACFDPGMAKNTYGTGIFLMRNTGATPIASGHGLLTTIAWGLGPASAPQITYALEGSIFVGGAAVQWLRDGLGIIKSSDEVEALAASVPDTAGVYLVPAFVGLGAPYWDAHARGGILGLTRGTTAAHIARATVASMAYQTRDVLDAMSADMAAAGVATSPHALRVDGGAAVNDLLMQFQSDILALPVERPRITETTAQGAAYLAGLATGFYADVAALGSQWVLDHRFTPTMPESERATKYRGWQRAVERCLGWEE